MPWPSSLVSNKINPPRIEGPLAWEEVNDSNQIIFYFPSLC
jgi:hypothetical protein